MFLNLLFSFFLTDIFLQGKVFKHLTFPGHQKINRDRQSVEKTINHSVSSNFPRQRKSIKLYNLHTMITLLNFQLSLKEY